MSSTRNWGSVHVRPEVAAFQELDTLVRKLTDQLAGYRRRAMSSEVRARELEAQLNATHVALTDTRSELSAASESREHALAAAREATAAAKLARAALSELEQTAAANGASSDAHPAGDLAGVSVGDLAAENARLRARLVDARERTAQLAERVRFLRQQLTQGADR